MKLLNPSTNPHGTTFWRALLKCPTLARHYTAGNRGAPSDAQARGILLHLVLAHHYAKRNRLPNFRQDGEALTAGEVMTPEDAAHALAEDQPVFRPWLGPVVEAYGAYCTYWGESDFDQVLALEHTLHAIGEYPVPYCQRADLLVKRQDKVWIIDHKGSGYSGGSSLFEQVSIDAQFVGYHWLGRQRFGKKFGGVILNQVSFEKGFRFKRAEIPVLPQVLADFEYAIRTAGDEWNRLQGKPMPKRFHSEVCWDRYGKCDHFDSCRGR